ncbi:MAG: hypothetical protein IPL78_10315 [Chloroflexi bacterium]|nr:hypothetical protein [Chloroflexota bacterium]
MNLSESTRRSLVSGLLLISSILYVALLITALGTRNRPFLVYFSTPIWLLMTSVAPNGLASHRIHRSNGPERLVAINDQTITSRRQLDDLLETAQPGDEWRMTFVHPDGSSRTLTLPLFTLNSQEFGRNFWLPYLIGAFILLVGFWAFRVHPDAVVAQYFALFSLLAAFGIGGLYDMLTTHILGRLWLTGLVGVGAANLYTAIEFPHRPRLLQQNPFLRWLPLVITLPLLVWAQVVLYNQNNPWLYVTAWRVAYVVDGVLMLLALGLFAYRAFASPVPLARQQGRVITLAACCSFFPIIIWFLNAGYIPFDPALFFLPTILYPLGMGYTIIRYRLLNVDVVLRRAVTYGLLTLALILVLGLVTTFVSSVLGVTVNTENAALLIALVLIITFLFDPIRKRVQVLVDEYVLARPQYETLLRRYNQELTSVAELEGGATLLIQYARRGVPHTDVQLFLPDTEQFYYQPYPTGVDMEIEADDPFVQLLARDRGALVLADEQAWPEEWRPHRTLCQQMKAAILVPFSNKQLIGWITLSRKHNNERFSTEEINYLNALADQSLLGIERVRIMRRLENRVAEMNDLSRFSQAVNTTQELDALLEIIVADSLRLLQCQDFAIILREPGTRQMYTAYYIENSRRRRDYEGPDKLLKDPIFRKF